MRGLRFTFPAHLSITSVSFADRSRPKPTATIRFWNELLKKPRLVAIHDAALSRDCLAIGGLPVWAVSVSARGRAGD